MGMAGQDSCTTVVFSSDNTQSASTSVPGAAAAAIASIPGGFMYMNCTPCLSLNFVCSSGPRKERVCRYSCSARNSACIQAEEAGPPSRAVGAWLLS